MKHSTTTKARLLHYFAQENPTKPSLRMDDPDQTPAEAEAEVSDSWCARHIDHGCLTGLTSALYINQAANPPNLKSSKGQKPPPLPFLPHPPSSSTGLYIQARDSSIVHVSIPSDCLAFQTGEALQIITKGELKAVPHFVQAEMSNAEGARVTRNTLAVFTQPELGEVIDNANLTTFGDLCQEVVKRFL